MKTGQSQMRRALIGLIDGRIDGARALDAAQWHGLGEVARTNRLEPLLHSHADALRGVVPDPLLAKWAAASRRSGMRSLKLQMTLIRVVSILSDHGIGHVALKGAWLAWHGYAKAAHRPMRDIDILAEPGKVRQAFDALLSAGFARRSEAVDPDFALVHHKHMPPVFDTQTGISVEVHSRITNGEGARDHDQAFDNAARLLAGARPLMVSGRAIAYPDPTDSLLHLIVHCAIDHRFSNGALILPDIEAALRYEINWPAFWAMAQAHGWERQSQLLLALAQRERTRMPRIATPLPAIPDAVLDATADLLVSVGTDGRGIHDLALAGVYANTAQSAKGGRALALLRRVVPSRHALAAFAGVSGSKGFVWHHYPRWALDRAGRLLATRQAHMREDVRRHQLVNNWTRSD